MRRTLEISSLEITSSLVRFASLLFVYVFFHPFWSTGTIPNSIGQLSHLRAFGVENNELSGTFPASMGSLNELKGLKLEGNKFSAPVLKKKSDLFTRPYLAGSSCSPVLVEQTGSLWNRVLFQVAHVLNVGVIQICTWSAKFRLVIFSFVWNLCAQQFRPTSIPNNYCQSLLRQLPTSVHLRLLKDDCNALFSLPRFPCHPCCLTRFNSSFLRCRWWEDACLDRTHTCPLVGANCATSPSPYHCSCKAGFTPVGSTPQGPNLCTADGSSSPLTSIEVPFPPSPLTS